MVGMSEGGGIEENRRIKRRVDWERVGQGVPDADCPGTVWERTGALVPVDLCGSAINAPAGREQSTC